MVGDVIKQLRSVSALLRFDTPLKSPRLDRVVDVADLRALARRRLPAGVFDYVDGAAEGEATAKRNTEAFDRVEFRPRVLRDVSNVDLRTTLLGDELSMPIVLAPTGFTRMLDAEGEVAVARAAGRARIPYCLSSLATRSIEEVARTSSGPLWFQVYMWRDRGLVRELVERASTAGCKALILTVDTPVLGRRDRDVRRGFLLPPALQPGTLLDGLRHPRWTWHLLTSEPIRFANVAGRSVGDGREAVALAEYVKEQFDPAVTWADIDWLRGIWDGPILLKGIQGVADAMRAADVGVDALAVSNHGGRQLDGAPVPLEILPSVADAVGGATAILCDGGVRRGTDVIKAIALGADAVMLGRAYLYGLGAAGEAGVDHVLNLFEADMLRTLALCGVASIADIRADAVRWRSAPENLEPTETPDHVP
jgi:L-lactate dehydrogenase (cytochrome)